MDEPPANPDYVCYPGKGGSRDLERLPLTSPFVEPFSFVLFNPYGGQGWSENMTLLKQESSSSEEEEEKEEEHNSQAIKPIKR